MKKELRAAYSMQEKAERLLANLEKLNDEGSITQDQYQALKADYTKIHRDAVSQVTEVKAKLQTDVDAKQKLLDIFRQELSNLEARFKVGELSAEVYMKSEQGVKRKLRKLEDQTSELRMLVATKSSADVGGYVDIEIQRPKEKRISLPSLPRIPVPQISVPGTLGEVVSSRLGVASLVVGIIMVITVFLPWEIGFSGIESGAGILCLIMGLVYAGVTFVAGAKIRSLGHIGAGAIAIIGLILFLGQTQGFFLEAGVWPCLVAAIGGIIVGVFELRRG